jgi:C4-dicarboxylate-specific signal transduction histidine kinase
MSAAAAWEQCVPDAQNSLEVLRQWFVRLDEGALAVDWCTRALSDCLPQWRSGRPVPELEREFRGLGELLARVRTEGQAQSVLAAPGGTAVGASAARDEHGTIHLRLADLRSDQEATARHLSDREQLLMMSRSLSVGEMASTLAHELNQPIGAITNLLRGLLIRSERGTLEPATAAPAIQRGIEHALYASGIIARVRDYVQHRQPKAEAVALRSLVDDAIALLDWEIRRDGVSVRVTCASEGREATVRGDRVLQQQVLVNLARNAIEAMRSIPQHERLLEVSIRVDEGSAVLGIADRGHGIDEAAAARLFTPFFTTKPGGMGIGLHVCRSIIELQQGRLWYTPRTPGPGCTFWIELPLAATEEFASS